MSRSVPLTRALTRVRTVLAALTLASLGSRPALAQPLLMRSAPAGVRAVSPASLGSGGETTGEVVVRFREGVSAERRGQLIGSSGSRISRVSSGSGYALVQVRDGLAPDLIRLLGNRSEVVSAEPCYRLHLLSQSLYDPYEWYLFDRGTVSAQATSDYGIQAASAWSLTRGSGVTVALVDSGTAFEDYSVFRQAPALSHTHFVAGYNVLDSTDHPDDTNGHGTHVAGILAGNLDNGGIVGVAPSATLMPVKVMGADGNGRDFDIADGIRWAADHGAQVINLSLGGLQAGSVLSDACQYATSKDCILVAAAGNEGASQVDFPAGYSSVISVGSIDFDGRRTPYSNYGRHLELVAPGGNLAEDLNGDGRPDGIVAQTFDPQYGYDQFQYEFWEGTSMAAPMVSGVAALVRSANPALGSLDARILIRNSAMRLGGTAGRNSNYGYGLVDALTAVKSALAQESP